VSVVSKGGLIQVSKRLFWVLNVSFLSSAISWASPNSPVSNASTNIATTNPIPLVQFLSPKSSASVDDATVQVRLQLRGPGIKSHNLKIYANNQNVTNLFSIGDCPWGLCEISGQLTMGSQLKHGWNSLRATVSTKSGATGRSRLKFYEKAGGLATGAFAASSAPPALLPQSIHVAMSSTQGIEVDYTPNGGNVPYFYPGSYTACSYGVLTMIHLDRTTLAYISTGCYGPDDNAKLQSDLATYTAQDLLLASTGVALGPLNLSLIGGTDFTQPSALPAYSYSIIGYGAAGPGLAAESYNTSSGAAWHGLEGNLTDIGVGPPSEGDYYGFVPTGSAGFALVPNGLNATLTVGNTQNLPTGTSNPLTNVPAGFTNVSYSAPPPADPSGGLWMLVLDRYTLQMISSTTYSTDNPDGSENQNQIQNLLNDINQLDNNANLVFITTLVGPYDPSNPNALPPLALNPEQSGYSNVLTAIMQMGVSPYGFARQVGGQVGINYPNAAPTASSFAMVGVPGQFVENYLPYDQTPSNNACTLPATATRACGANKDQWFSSALDTQQQETGALQGTLTRNRAYQYTPTSVAPFVPTNGESADNLLSNSIARAIGAAPSVAWPMMDTPGHLAAYAYLSSLLVAKDIEHTATCDYDDQQYCTDIRYYYTGSQAADLTNGSSIDPETLTCPTNSGSFTQADCTDVAQQLSAERGLLSNVQNFQNTLGVIHSDIEASLALQLTLAANDVLNQVSAATPSTNVKADSMSLGIDSLDLASGVVSLAAFIPGADAVAGVLGGVIDSTAGILELVNDSQQSTDDYQQVKQLSDLISTSQNDAAQAATDFDNSLTTSTDDFFDGVLSDWFKLQAIGTMSVNPANQGSWYFSNEISGTTYAPYIQAAARKNFYEQILAQNFSTIYDRILGAAPLYPQWSYVPQQFASPTALYQWLIPFVDKSSITGSYSWSYRDAFPGNYTSNTGSTHFVTDGLWDFNFVVLNSNNKQGWSDTLGNTLMGPPSAADGSGNLNLNRDMLYDSGTFPTIYSAWFPYDNNQWCEFNNASSCQ
jgi:hypothetical protein